MKCNLDSILNYPKYFGLLGFAFHVDHSRKHNLRGCLKSMRESKKAHRGFGVFGEVYQED
jgi:hypothetical protein